MSGVGTASSKALSLNPPRCYYITRPLDQSGPRALLIKSPVSYESSPLVLQLRQPRLTAPKVKENSSDGSTSQFGALRLTTQMAWLYSLDRFAPRLRRLVLTTSTAGVLSWGDLRLWFAKT